MSIDVRAFTYALEPLRKRRSWEMEAVEARLGLVNREIALATSQLEHRRQKLVEQHAKAADGMVRRMDPSQHRRTLSWLVRLREEIGFAQRHLEELKAARSKLMAEYAATQNRLAAIDSHRMDCLADYARAEQGRLAAAADADWLARRHTTPPSELSGKHAT